MESLKSVIVTYKMSVLKMASAVPDRARRRSRYGGERSFSFIALILAHARARTRAALRGGRVRAYLQRAPELFISRIFALLQIRKKRGRAHPPPPCTLAHHIKLLRLLSTFLSSARAFRSYPPHPVDGGGAREKKFVLTLGGCGNWSGTDQHAERRR